MAKTYEPETSNSVNMIVAGTVIKGNIESSNDIRFDGNLVGNLKTSGKLIIGPTGQVKGEVYCKNSDIEGKIEGRVVAQELLTLKSTSLVEGDLMAKRLAIEPGAKFTGNCNMNGSTAPKTEADKEIAGTDKK
ncbi:MAG: polymer-forming cytoskeletal protein [Bacteroidales bacterium]|nr:polymer-forming cytoskeletal protein [Bacteroidales bacterium]MBN2821228.1 polymer-forming cytoskeletal protein [Bacteroidales bacterium]